jgi:hypothetical protein
MTASANTGTITIRTNNNDMHVFNGRRQSSSDRFSLSFGRPKILMMTAAAVLMVIAVVGGLAIDISRIRIQSSIATITHTAVSKINSVSRGGVIAAKDGSQTMIELNNMMSNMTVETIQHHLHNGKNFHDVFVVDTSTQQERIIIPHDHPDPFPLFMIAYSTWNFTSSSS